MHDDIKWLEQNSFPPVSAARSFELISFADEVAKDKSKHDD